MVSRDAMRRVVVTPLDRLRVAIGGADVAHQLSAQVSGGGEDASCDNVTLQLLEPELDLVEPGRVSGREVQPHVGMQAQEVLDPAGLMRGEVVEDDVDLAAAGMRGNQAAEKSHELFAGVSCRGPAEHLAGL